MEHVGGTLCVPVDQRVHEALGSPARTTGTAKEEEAADGCDGDAGAADAQHLPAAQPGDHLVVAGLSVLPLLWLTVLPPLGLPLLWGRLPALGRCLPLWLPLAGLSLPGLSTLGLALPGLSALRLALAGLSLSGLAATGLSAATLLWLSATGLPALWLSLSRLALLWLTALLGLAALLWLATLLGLATLGVALLCALAVCAVAPAAVLSTLSARNIFVE
ncbi:hypothetical protein [Salinirussus salinus]|uniref:hypothetical protein n=1 Tax=Salinirussus salinus TaxID=1198300 RepID=UPI001F459A73|nr:hypothetical protein [Salinirussus salinus]